MKLFPKITFIPPRGFFLWMIGVLSVGFLGMIELVSTEVRAQEVGNIIYLPIVEKRLGNAWIGPGGGKVVALALDPSDPLVMYAGTWGAGVFRSDDGGLHWTVAIQGVDNLLINALAVAPGNPNLVYAGTYRGGVYRSRNAGLSWESIGNGMQGEMIVYSLAVDPLDNDLVLAATRRFTGYNNRPWQGIVYRSEDGGDNWVPILQDIGGPDQQDWVYSLAFDPNKPEIIYAATHEFGPFRSADRGLHWRQELRGVDDYSSRVMAPDPSKAGEGTVYLGLWKEDAVLKSNLYGTWWYISSQGMRDAQVYDLAVNTYDSQILYAASFNYGVFKTINAGLEWRNIGFWGQPLYAIEVHPDHPDLAYLGTADSGLFRTVNGGISWDSSSAGLLNTTVTGWLTQPGQPGRLTASVFGNGGIHRSEDFGASWYPFNAGLGSLAVNVLASDPVNPQVLYALTENAGLFRWTSEQNAWAEFGQGLPYPQLDPSEAYIGRLVSGERAALTAGIPDREALEWGNQSNNLNMPQRLHDPQRALAFAPSAPHVMYLGTNYLGVYRSLNGGASWSQAGLNGHTIESLVVSVESPWLVFAALTSGGLVRSTDSGATWGGVELGDRLVYALGRDLNGFIYASTSFGLLRWDGTSWVSAGLDGLPVTGFTVHPSNPLLRAAGTTIGAYYSLDGGVTWQQVPTLVNAWVTEIAWDANLPAIVYYGLLGRGGFRLDINP